MDDRIALLSAPLSVPLTLVEVPDAMRARLASLGLRPGAQLTLAQRTTGGGRLVALGSSRLALGETLLRQLRVVVA